MEGLAARVGEMLDHIQLNLFERAVRFREEHTQRVESYTAFKDAMEGRPGFMIAAWCGSRDCEAQIKTETQATIRNMPLNGPTPSGTCVRCDSPAQAEAWFAKSQPDFPLSPACSARFLFRARGMKLEEIPSVGAREQRERKRLKVGQELRGSTRTVEHEVGAG